jgi:protein gp37
MGPGRPKLIEAGERLGALFTFASVEPMLERIWMGDHCPDWVICGGESGREARDMPERWASTSSARPKRGAKPSL